MTIAKNLITIHISDNSYLVEVEQKMQELFCSKLCDTVDDVLNFVEEILGQDTSNI